MKINVVVYMPVVIKEINSLLETLEAEDYTSVLDYVKLVSQNRGGASYPPVLKYPTEAELSKMFV